MKFLQTAAKADTRWSTIQSICWKFAAWFGSWWLGFAFCRLRSMFRLCTIEKMFNIKKKGISKNFKVMILAVHYLVNCIENSAWVVCGVELLIYLLLIRLNCYVIFQVIEAKMMRNYEDDRFKGFAYIEFRTREDLERALTLNGVVSVTEV